MDRDARDRERRRLGAYCDLCRRYVRGDLTAAEFSTAYLDLFLDRDGEFLWSEATFRPLNDLFLVAEAYCPDPELRDDWEADEAELAAAARETATDLYRRRRELANA